MNQKIYKENKGIGIIKHLRNFLPRNSLLTIYKSFIRPRLDYGDVIYDQPNNETFNHKIESVQYNATLAITEAIKGISRERLYQELSLESMKDRRWYRRLTYFYNIVNGNCLEYLKNKKYRPSKQHSHNNELSNYFVYLFYTQNITKTPFFHSVLMNEIN